MSIFDMYRDRAREFTVTNKANESMFLTRKGRGNTVSAINNDKSALMQDDTKLDNGDICIEVDNGDTYFVIAKQSSIDANRCQLRKTNCTIDIVEIKKHFTGKVNDYDYEVPLHTSVTAFYEDVSARMQQYDMGLLSKSTRRFLVPVLDFKLTDRIKFNGEIMMVEGINATSYPGSLWVQCSPDTRKTKVV